MMVFRFFLFVLPLVGFLSASGQTPAAGLTLSEAIQRGLEQNYGIQIAEADLAAVNNDNNWALTGRYPTISLGLSPSVVFRDNVNPASIVSMSTITNYGVAPSANLNWTLFNGGRVRIAKEQLDALANLSESQLQIEVENTVQSIIQAYYQAVVQQERIGVLQRVNGLSRDRIEYQELRQEYGQGGSFDLLQARDAYLNDSINLQIQEFSYETALRNLLQLMGDEELNTDIQLTTALSESESTYNRQALIDRMLSSNANLSALRVNQELAAINTRLAESENSIQIGLQAGLSYDITVQTGTQTFDFGSDQPTREQELPGVASRTLQGNLGINATYLLFDGGARNVRTQTARLREVTSRLDLEGTKQQLKSTLLNLLASYDNQLAVLALTRQLIDNAAANLELAEERLRGGTINSFDYRAVQLSYLNAEFQLLQALLDLKVTETDILRLTGQIVNGGQG
ncbi:MAG: TolC family protein [Bacteroidota bacterium]